jgi:hypothetical protein
MLTNRLISFHVKRAKWLAEPFKDMNAAEYEKEQIKMTNECDLRPSVDNLQKVKCLEAVPWYGSGGVHGGLYALHLKHWLSHFDAEQFLLIPMSAYKRDPVPALTAIANRLGLDISKLDQAKAEEKIGQHINLDPERNPGDLTGTARTPMKDRKWVGKISRSKEEQEAAFRLKAFFAPFNEQLAELVEAKNVPRVKGGEGAGGLF